MADGPQEAASKKDAVKVCVRVRPLNRLEKRTNQDIAWQWSPYDVKQRWFPVDRSTQSLHTTKAAPKEPIHFFYDHVFAPEHENLHIYQTVGEPIVVDSMRGFHGCIFAYGQTSSGKTYTIHGTSKSPGMIPQAVETIFSYIDETPEREFVLRVSYVEIYNEVVNDLLNPASVNLRIREDRHLGVFVENLKEDVVMSADQVFSLLHAGTSHRHIGRTNYNDVSSRSHTIFRIVIESSARGKKGVRLSALNLVDLAGSENAVKAGSAARQKETGYINKSLLTLGHVIYKLSEGSAEHIPYRDSKLTRILQSSLSGKAKVAVVCTVSPSSGNLEESVSTLKFANRAKKVEQRAILNEKQDADTLLQQYRDEIQRLRKELEDAKTLADITWEAMEEQKKSDERVRAAEEEKHGLLAKIQQLERLILHSSNPEAAAHPHLRFKGDSKIELEIAREDGTELKTDLLGGEKESKAGSAASHREDGSIRKLPSFEDIKVKRKMQQTLPKGFKLASGAPKFDSPAEFQLSGVHEYEPDEAAGDAGDDLLCDIVTSEGTDAKKVMQLAAAAPADELRKLVSKLAEELEATRREVKDKVDQLEQLQFQLDEKDSLLAEWDEYFVTQRNQREAFRNELQRVASEVGVQPLRDLFALLEINPDEDFDTPLVDVDGASKQGSSAKFNSVINKWRSIEQD